MYSSVMTPCPRRFLNAGCSLSERFSNMSGGVLRKGYFNK
jgi:hypothetical protein